MRPLRSLMRPPRLSCCMTLPKYQRFRLGDIPDGLHILLESGGHQQSGASPGSQVLSYPYGDPHAATSPRK